MAPESDDVREQGIEFGGLLGDLEDESYPLSHETLLSRYGDHELGLFDTRISLREVLSEQEREYEDVESVQQAVFNMVDDEAVGREGYTDRGGHAADDDSHESESF